MSDQPYAWGAEHFCEPDTEMLYNSEPQRLYDPALGFPVKLDALPDPETFCSVCLKWFTDPANLTGSEHRPPESSTEA